MVEDEVSDPTGTGSTAEAVASYDRERQERLVYAFAELEGVFELVEATVGDDSGDVVRALMDEVEAARKRLTYEPDTVAESELRELIHRIGDELAIDFEPTDSGSD